MSRQLKLRDLLVSLFTPEELRRFLLHGPDGETILRSLPEGTSFAELADASVEALVRRGLVDERLFERLAEARPRRIKDIESALQSWKKIERRAEQRAEAKWDFFIIYARPDRPRAREFYDELKSPECRVFMDVYDITAGDIWDLAILDAQRNSLVTVVLLSSTGGTFSQREAIATGLSLARDPNSGHRVVPVFLEELDPVDVSNTLKRLQGLSIRESGGLQEVALMLRNLLETLPSQRELQLEASDPFLSDLARRFFEAAGRQVEDGHGLGEIYVLLGASRGEKSVSEPVEVCSEPQSSRVEVRKLAARLHPGLIGYFVHRGELSLDTEAALNTLRVQGQSSRSSPPMTAGGPTVSRTGLRSLGASIRLMPSS